MADKNIVLKIKVEKGESTVTLKNFENQVIKSGVAIKDLSNSIGNFTTSKLKMDGQVKVTTDQFKRLEKSVGGFKTATGASTSATLELGRVLSDMPYGIRGVANNLQQLASNLFFMSKATDVATGKSVGFMGAVKKLLGGLIGPAGILIAFQGVIALFDYFSSGAKKAEEASDSFDVSVSSLNKTLYENYISQEDVNDKIKEYLVLQSMKGRMSEKEKERLVKIKEAEGKINEQLKVQENQRKKIAKYKAEGNEKAAKFLEKQIEDNKVINYYRDIQIKLLKESQVEFDKTKQALDSFNAAEEGTLKALKQSKKEFERKRETLSKTSEDYKRLSKDIEDTQKKIEAIEGRKVKGSGKSKFSPFKTQEELDLDVKNQENAIIKLNKSLKLQELNNAEKTELLYAKTEEDKIDIKKRYAKERLEIQYKAEKKSLELSRDTEIAVAKEKAKNHAAQLRRNFEEFQQKVNHQVALKKLSQKDADSLLSKAAGEVFDKSVQAEKELKSTVKEIGEAYSPLFSVFEKLYNQKRKALSISDDDKAKDFDALSSYLQSFKIAMSGTTEFVNGEYDRQLTIEQNKTNTLNEQLNNRLLNEQLSADQRKNIQNQIYQNDETLRKKQDEIAKKKFNTAKAFNIIMATVDTYSAANKVLNDPALTGQPWARGIMAGATIFSGLANVAAIARQKFQSLSAATPVRTSSGGGGGAGVGDRSFNFNLVGNTVGNQITDAIQGQFDKPLKAYVVSRDVTNQQALDANIKGTASF